MKYSFGKWFLAAVIAGILATGAGAAEKEPQTGGHLNVITGFRTLNALTWDVQRWPWKANHDHLGAESLLKGDLSRGLRGTREFSFNFPDHIPEEVTIGSLAERWEETPQRLTFYLRKGVEWMEVPGVMERRPLTASDVANHFEVMRRSPRYIPGYWDFIERWEVVDDHTLVAHLSRYHANWPYHIGWGFWDGIMPPEWHALDAAQRADWKNAPGTGPYRVSEVQRGRVQSYTANPHYWGTETINGKEYRLPLNRGVTYMIVVDESSAIAQFTSGRADIMEGIRWQFIDQVRRAAPEVLTVEGLGNGGTYIALRNDRPPFDDVRVRRAMNLAVDQQAILKTVLNGRGELLNYPYGPGFGEYYQPISELPPAAQELFAYDPEKARALLAEAGYPDGFEVDLMMSANNPFHNDVIGMLLAYYQRIGVTVNVKPLDYPVFVSQMRRDTMAPMYLMDNSAGNPIAVMRKTFQCEQHWNASMHCDEKFDRDLARAKAEPDRAKRREMLRELNRYILTERVPHVWLPTGVGYIAWWPWVKNYGGETRVGAMRPNDVYARIWIDEEEKQRILSRR